MNRNQKLSLLVGILVFGCYGCASTSEQNEANKKDLTLQERIMNKFSFHTQREHRERRREQEQYEREQYRAQMEKSAQEKKELK